MAKVLNRPMKVSDEDHKEGVELQPGDEVPSWAEDYVEAEWLDEGGPQAAGTNLFDDNVYQVVKAVADERGVEYGKSWDAAQIAAAIRYQEHAEQVVADLDLDEDEEAEALDEGRKAMADLFNSTNEGGNVHAPDQAAKSSRGKSSSSPSGTSGGAQSSST